MPTVKELKAQAKAAGLSGYSSLNKDDLIELLEGSDAAAAPGDGVEGMPTEPEKGNFSPAEQRAIKLIGGRRTVTAAANEGKPSEPERGGLTPKDLNAKGAFDKVERAKPGAPPSITGNDSKPTEADRGGLNDLERKLAGV